MTFKEAVEQKVTKKLTENGAVTYTSSLNSVVDLFAFGGAMRARSDADITDLVRKACTASFDMTLQVLFYLRDVRGGQGERRFFRVAMQYVLSNYTVPRELLALIPEYGRWDDLIHLYFVASPDNRAGILDTIKWQLDTDIHNYQHGLPVSLLGKWLPSINASSKETCKRAYALVHDLGGTPRIYRKILSALRGRINLLEQKMSSNEWSTLELDKLPSQAFLKHMGAFQRHIPEQFTQFLEDVKNKKKTVHTGTLYPHQVVEKKDSEGADTLWENLPDYTQGTQKAIVVADVSGSMTWVNNPMPLDVSVALALYFSERNVGPFKDMCITFSNTPTLHKIEGDTIGQRFQNMAHMDWGGSTNINAVFDLLLTMGVEHDIPNEDMPSTLYIITDMEFDNCGHLTNYEAIQQKYEDAGYTIPSIVFWNVSARNNTVPVRSTQNKVSLVSGFSPVIFKQVMENKTPVEVMVDTVSTERYEPVRKALT